jgi:CheY-like chemotaxis protein
VLVVGTDRAVRRLLVRILGLDGHWVLEARDHEVALAVAEAASIDLLVMDGPRVLADERELLARLRADGRAQRVPILVVGHGVGRDEWPAARHAPFDEAEILQAARDLLDRGAARSAPERFRVTRPPHPEPGPADAAQYL